jgi:hypothetical protein
MSSGKHAHRACEHDKQPSARGVNSVAAGSSSHRSKLPFLWRIVASVLLVAAIGFLTGWGFLGNRVTFRARALSAFIAELPAVTRSEECRDHKERFSCAAEPTQAP